MYTGRFHMNDTLSEPIEKLRIISDETSQFAQYVLGQHIPRKYFSQRQAEDEALPEEAKTKTRVYGASLLLPLPLSMDKKYGDMFSVATNALFAIDAQVF